MSEEYSSVKQLIQGIALNSAVGLRSAPEVDEVISSWVDRGYTLLSAHVLVKEADFMQVLYVLVKYPTV